MRARVLIRPKAGILDPQGVAVAMPEQHRLADAARRELRVDLVAGAGDLEDAELHGAAWPSPSRSCTS